MTDGDGPACQREKRGEKGTATDGVTVPVTETGEEGGELAGVERNLGIGPR
jgi:hypothetical protein